MCSCSPQARMCTGCRQRPHRPCPSRQHRQDAAAGLRCRCRAGRCCRGRGSTDRRRLQQSGGRSRCAGAACGPGSAAAGGPGVAGWLACGSAHAVQVLRVLGQSLRCHPSGQCSTTTRARRVRAGLHTPVHPLMPCKRKRAPVHQAWQPCRGLLRVSGGGPGLTCAGACAEAGPGAHLCAGREAAVRAARGGAAARRGG